MTGVSATTLAALLADWRAGGPAERQLAATVRALVLDGRLPLESRLPAERELAAALGISRSTVTAAYNRLRRDGYLRSRQGAGSWVTIPGGHRAAADGVVPARGLDLRIAALPAPPELEAIAAAAVRALPRWLDHHGYDPLGLPPLRAAIARRFTARGLPTTSEQILVVNGALQALELAVRATLPRGRIAVAELPGYPAALDLLRAAGSRVQGVPVGPDGWDLEQLRGHAARGLSLAYLIPDFQNPSGVLVDDAGRRRALRMLRTAEATVVVDETFVELNLDSVQMPAPAASHDAATITVGSLSKPVWGGLRIGWLRAEPSTVQRIAALRAITDMASPVLEQLVAVGVFDSLDAIVAERVELLRTRRAALLEALHRHAPAWTCSRPHGGLFLWVELPSPIATSLSVRARERGVHFTPGPRFGAAGLLERKLRLPFTLPPDQLDRAVEVLASAAGELAPTSRAALEPAYVV
ncbi:MAG TPA: PLP-dependent aminotransferase family protein [Gaiellaceae bacterium]|nr:PLP-dependent aminotransferase family protein [Gaiellaceae bacterium]